MAFSTRPVGVPAAVPPRATVQAGGIWIGRGRSSVTAAGTAGNGGRGGAGSQQAQAPGGALGDLLGQVLQGGLGGGAVLAGQPLEAVGVELAPSAGPPGGIEDGRRAAGHLAPAGGGDQLDGVVDALTRMGMVQQNSAEAMMGFEQALADVTAAVDSTTRIALVVRRHVDLKRICSCCCLP